MAMTHFAPFVPDAGNPFDNKKAAHLLRRAGFGASPPEIAAAVEKGLEETVEDLFADAPDEEAQFQSVFDSINGRMINFGDPNASAAWWVHRMVSTRVPLREKLALFWHGHFATSVSKIESSQLMLQQIDMLRKHAWGSFRDLLLAVAKDPAMIAWLDGETNTKEHPNENFARELMELFTCGIGNYTEKDVQEAARAFTGWHRDGTNYVFRAEAHDDGLKRFLGKRGKFDGTDIIDILLAQPATDRFLAKKLLRFFACPDPADDVVQEGAELLDRNQLNVKWFLRELFLSKYFYSEACYRRRIASPAEFVVGTLRTLEAKIPVPDLIGNMNQMGQQLLAPPNVKGWDGEERWINSTALAARAQVAKMIPEQNSGPGAFGPHTPVEKFVPTGLQSPREIIDGLVTTLFQGELPEETRRELETFLISNEEGPQPQAFRDDEGFRTGKTRAVAGIMLALPEYQTY